MATGRPFTVEQVLSIVSEAARGAYQSKITDKVSIATLKGFAEWLVQSEGKSPNTARAYKSWVAKAMVERGAREPHVLSALKAFDRYNASKGRT